MKTLIHVAAVALTGCALTAKGDALAIRWYTPESSKATLTDASIGGDIAQSAPQIALGRITSGINLREKIAYRNSAFEEGFYDDKRWTERPEVFVRRALEKSLYEEHGFRRALASQAPVLEVEVVDFEEVLGPVHAARIELRIVIHDDRDTLLERTITVERPVDPHDSGFTGVVQAMAQALDAAANATTNDVQRVMKR
jgi:cholesterol transport system auxiliary component